VPFFMLILFLASLALAFQGPFYLLALAGQALFYLAAWLRHSYDGLKRISGLLSLPHTFGLVNLAILYGWIQYFKGETYVVWAPSRR